MHRKYANNMALLMTTVVVGLFAFVVLEYWATRSRVLAERSAEAERLRIRPRADVATSAPVYVAPDPITYPFF